MSLSGKSLGGFPVSVQLTQAEKNRAAQQSQQSIQQERSMKLYVSNIHTKVTNEDIRPVFSAFGDLLSLEIKLDHRGRSKGYGFVEFKKETDAIGAMQQLNGLEILGQKIKVVAADPNQISNINNSNNNNTTGNNDSLLNNIDLNGQQSSLKDESGNGGLSLSTAGKLALMKKLSRGQVKNIIDNPDNKSNLPFDPTKLLTNASIHKTVVPTHIATPVSSFNNKPQNVQQSTLTSKQTLQNDSNPNNNNNKNIKSRCVLLKNMFDPLTETDPDFDLEIREDVKEEVAKFGKLLHIYVHKTSREGLVYLKFSKINEAALTIQNLNGRWFAKNQINAMFVDENQYSQQFPDSN